MPRLFDDYSQTIGNTPLVRLNHITQHRIYAKVESRNPAFSVKCRIGAAMVWDAERSGRLSSGMELVEATSGNTGIALAFVAAARGYGLTLTMPDTMSMERRKVLGALGAKLILTEGAQGMPGAIRRAEELVASDPERYLLVEQFRNPANPAIHEQTTGPEIWEATEGEEDIFISGVGTGGTITGVSRHIKRGRGKDILSVAVEPSSSTVIRAALEGGEPSHGPHKIQGIGAGFIPETLDLSVVDEVQSVTDEAAMDWAHRLMRSEGILAGTSSGAAMAAAVRGASRPGRAHKQVVVRLWAGGARSLSTPLFAGRFDEQGLLRED